MYEQAHDTLNRLPHNEHSKQRSLDAEEEPADDVIDDAACWRRWQLGKDVGQRGWTSAAVVAGPDGDLRAQVDVARWTRLSGSASGQLPGQR